MSPRILLPVRASPELRWTAQLIGNWLLPTLDISEESQSPTDSVLTITDGTRSLLLPCDGFGRDGYGALLLGPHTPMREFTPGALRLRPRLSQGTVCHPIGDFSFERTAHGGRLSGHSLRLVFELLSCISEFRSAARDALDRVPIAANASHACGISARAVVDEHIEVIRAAINELWPGLSETTDRGAIQITCDVDHAVDHSCRTLRGAMRRASAVAMGYRDEDSVAHVLTRYLRTRFSPRDPDPYQVALDFLMDVAEQLGVTVLFYFIPFAAHAVRDRSSDVRRDPHAAMLRHVLERRHRVGAHPGYGTCRDPRALSECAQLIREAHDRCRHPLDRLCTRQHYLHWCPRVTAASLDEAGFDEDSTLGYPDGAGFRCGTGRSFPMFDLALRRPLRIMQRPLVAMDVALLGGRRRADSDTQALCKLNDLRRETTFYGGDFTCLWHNSELNGTRTRALMSRSCGLEATSG